MKYIEEYLKERMKIKVLGELKLIDEYVDPDTPIGNRLVIDGIDSDIVVWYVDYAMWIEDKYEELKSK